MRTWEKRREQFWGLLGQVMIFVAGFIGGVATTSGTNNATIAAAVVVVVCGSYLSSRYN